MQLLAGIFFLHDFCSYLGLHMPRSIMAASSDDASDETIWIQELLEYNRKAWFSKSKFIVHIDNSCTCKKYIKLLQKALISECFSTSNKIDFLIEKTAFQAITTSSSVSHIIAGQGSLHIDKASNGLNAVQSTCLYIQLHAFNLYSDL